MKDCSLIEIWRTRPEWFQLSKTEKQAFIDRGGAVLGALAEKGAKMMGLHRCRSLSEGGWDLFAYWQVPNIDLVVELAEGLDRMGWNRYFEQINFVGKNITTEEYFADLLAD
jgi:hypothetical protein